MGIGMGFSYDLLRSFRREINHNDFLVGLEDIAYWLIWTWVFIENIFKFNDGSFRIYIFISAITGLLIYKNTISGGIFKITNYILCFVKKCLEKPKKLLKNGVFWFKIKVSVLSKKFKEKEKDALKQSGRVNNERTGKKEKKKVNKKTV